MENDKIKCELCGKEFYMTSPEKGCPYCNGENKNNNISCKNNANNTIAIVLKVIGWLIIVVGFIGGISLGQNIYEYGNYEFNYVAMLICWLSCGISAILLFALSEIIQILHDIRLKLRKRK